MKRVAHFALILALSTPIARSATEAELQIERVLNVQVDAWNRGDIPAFVTTYTADCIFVGKEVARGRAQLLARYEKSYPTREAMGHLTFGAIQTTLLTPDVAIVTGKWHIERSGPAGKALGGVFSLVLHRQAKECQAKEWKIALDHTS